MRNVRHQQRTMLNKLFTWFKSSELVVSILVAGVAVAVVAWLDYRYGINWPDVQVEAHGLLMDIFVFGVLILAFNKVREKRNLKRHYHEEIDDFRDWKEEEAKYRILGNVKRLARLGEKHFDLNRCYLEGSWLEGLELNESDLNCVNLSNAYISNCCFKNVNFRGAQFSKATIRCSSFIGCQIDAANYFDAILYKVDFDNSDLSHFDESNNLHKVRSIYDPKNLNAELLDTIRKQRPELLDKPTFETMNRWTDTLAK